MEQLREVGPYLSSGHLSRTNYTTSNLKPTRRDTKEKTTVSLDGIEDLITAELDAIQKRLFDSALQFRSDLTTFADTEEQFVEVLNEKGGFIKAHLYILLYAFITLSMLVNIKLI